MGIFGSSIAEGAQRRPDAGSTRPSSGIPGSTDLLTLNLAKSGDLAKSGGPTGILGGVSVGNLIGGSLADRMPLR